MTREDAITILDCERPYGSCGCGATDEEIEEALDMAIKALEQNPCEPVRNPDQLTKSMKNVIDIPEQWEEEMTLVNWQYCNDPNDINEAIKTKDEDWEGLTSANEIISITYDNNHGCYVVFWVMERSEKS